MAHRRTLSKTTLAPAHYAGQELRAIRTRLGLDQRTFARHLAVHVTSISQWENGAREPSLTVVKLARYLLLSLTPTEGFIPDPPDRNASSVELSPAHQCFWRHADPLPCAGRHYRLAGRLSRRRHVTTSVCEQHLVTAFAAVDKRLTEAARTEQYRQGKMLEMRGRRRQAREAVAAQPAS